MGQKERYIGMPVEETRGGIQIHEALGYQWRDPVGVTFVHPPWELDEGPQVAPGGHGLNLDG
jgi:hypothetical protein